ncbi:MAG: peptidoglycan editing factor PgeF [Burkholderiales bacterium]|jgi:YfiH family protein|nr:peptidoglycan editing factor PgeF [Burkholderiales bacterium]
MSVHGDWIVPAWAAPRPVRALFTTRRGGVSTGPWGGWPERAGGMNLGAASGDDPRIVQANRRLLRASVPAKPRWLQQVHGAVVVDAEAVAQPPPADAAVACTAGVVCVVTVADCVPVLLADVHGRAVAAGHAGWRGLAAGVLQATVARMRERLADPAAQIVAWLGPAIGPTRFEVGGEVRAAMQTRLPQAAKAFAAQGDGKWLANLFALARQALAQVGVTEVTGGEHCTASDARRFYSHRRDRGVTGRHAALIWIGDGASRRSVESV